MHTLFTLRISAFQPRRYDNSQNFTEFVKANLFLQSRVSLTLLEDTATIWVLGLPATINCNCLLCLCGLWVKQSGCLWDRDAQTSVQTQKLSCCCTLMCFMVCTSPTQVSCCTLLFYMVYLTVPECALVKLCNRQLTMFNDGPLYPRNQLVTQSRCMPRNAIAWTVKVYRPQTQLLAVHVFI